MDEATLTPQPIDNVQEQTHFDSIKAAARRGAQIIQHIPIEKFAATIRTTVEHGASIIGEVNENDQTTRKKNLLLILSAGAGGFIVPESATGDAGVDFFNNMVAPSMFGLGASVIESRTTGEDVQVGKDMAKAFIAGAILRRIPDFAPQAVQLINDMRLGEFIAERSQELPQTLTNLTQTASDAAPFGLAGVAITGGTLLLGTERGRHILTNVATVAYERGRQTVERRIKNGIDRMNQGGDTINRRSENWRREQSLRVLRMINGETDGHNSGERAAILNRDKDNSQAIITVRTLQRKYSSDNPQRSQALKDYFEDNHEQAKNIVSFITSSEQMRDEDNRERIIMFCEDPILIVSAVEAAGDVPKFVTFINQIYQDADDPNADELTKQITEYFSALTPPESTYRELLERQATRNPKQVKTCLDILARMDHHVLPTLEDNLQYIVENMDSESEVIQRRITRLKKQYKNQLSTKFEDMDVHQVLSLIVPDEQNEVLYLPVTNTRVDNGIKLSINNQDYNTVLRGLNLVLRQLQDFNETNTRRTTAIVDYLTTLSTQLSQINPQLLGQINTQLEQYRELSNHQRQLQRQQVQLQGAVLTGIARPQRRGR